VDFSLSETQRATRDETIEFARETLDEDWTALDRAGEFPREAWRRCADFGIQGAVIPEALGGRGIDVLTAVLMLEGLGYGCRDNGLPFALASQMWSVQAALMRFANDDQKARYLPELCRGGMIGAFGITEVDSGSDTYALQARAEKTEHGYLLNGRKSYVTLAPVADMAIVFATGDPALGRWGISAFVVDEATPGFSTSAVVEKMGMRSCPMGELILEDCEVPESHRLGPEGAGASIFATAMESERGYIFACQLGAMQRQLEEAVAYARERTQFGQPIGRFQSVSNRLADMKMRLEIGRMLLYKAAWSDASGQPSPMDAALAKLQLSEAFVASSLDNIRTHGARGFVTEYGIERDLRDGIGGLIYSGTSDIQRNIIARLLGL
jgi:alkylation response protein AidB-like acyl-CoA dehydrogenase